MPFNLKNRIDLVRLLNLIGRNLADEPPPEAGPEEQEPITHGWIYKTPVGGIPARSGIRCGTADCTPYYIDPSDDLKEIKDNDGDSQTVEIYHIGGKAVNGSAFIQVKKVFSKLVVDMEDCSP